MLELRWQATLLTKVNVSVHHTTAQIWIALSNSLLLSMPAAAVVDH